MVSSGSMVEERTGGVNHPDIRRSALQWRVLLHLLWDKDCFCSLAEVYSLAEANIVRRVCPYPTRRGDVVLVEMVAEATSDMRMLSTQQGFSLFQNAKTRLNE